MPNLNPADNSLFYAMTKHITSFFLIKYITFLIFYFLNPEIFFLNYTGYLQVSFCLLK